MASEERRGYVLCMQPDEGAFFETLLSSPQFGWTRCVQTLAELQGFVDEIGGPVVLISFCSDMIVPGTIIDRLAGECFNFHSGPPERPGYRPAAFAAVEGASSYGVTFHRMVAEIDAGPIYAVRRFDLQSGMSEEEVSELAYVHLLRLATEVAGWVADPGHTFQPTGEVWGVSRTTKADYRRVKGTR